MALPFRLRLRNTGAYYLSYIIYRQNGTVNRRLLNFIDYILSLFPTASPTQYAVVSSDLSIDPARNLWFRIYSPATHSPSKLPLIVYFHGGGFVSFSPQTKPIDDFCRRLAGDLPAVVVSVNYRLSPEHRFPSPYDDGFDVLRHIDASAGNEFGVGDLERCFLAGDSAGANLAHHVAVQGSGFGFRRLRIRGIVSIQPFFGGEERTESEIRLGKKAGLMLSLRSTDIFWKAFLPVGSDRDHPAARVFGSGPGVVDLAGVEYPPTLVFVGGKDLLKDWQGKYGDWLAGSGKDVRVVEYPNMFHGFYVESELPEASMLVHEIAEFMNSP